MRVPSTSDLCQAQANQAYDKLAVISDNIEELQALYNFIFDVQEYIRQLLKNYVTLSTDQTIDSTKTFTKPIRVEDINFYNALDELDNIVNITTGYDDNDPYFLITLTRKDMELLKDITGTIKLKLDLTNNIPIFEAVDTVGTDEQSVVVVKYLNQVVSNLNDLISALDVRVTALETALTALTARVTEIEERLNTLEGVDLLDTVEETKSDGVKSSGIYKFVKDIETELRKLISTVDGKAYPVCTKTQLGIAQAGTGIDVAEGVISVDLEALGEIIGGGEEYEFGGVSGWRLWRVGNLAVIHVPASVVTLTTGDTTGKDITLPISVSSIIYNNYYSVGSYTLTLKDSTTVTLTYAVQTAGSGQIDNNAFDLICWL